MILVLCFLRNVTSGLWVPFPHTLAVGHAATFDMILPWWQTIVSIKKKRYASSFHLQPSILPALLDFSVLAYFYLKGGDIDYCLIIKKM